MIDRALTGSEDGRTVRLRGPDAQSMKLDLHGGGGGGPSCSPATNAIAMGSTNAFAMSNARRIRPESGLRATTSCAGGSFEKEATTMSITSLLRCTAATATSCPGNWTAARLASGLPAFIHFVSLDVRAHRCCCCRPCDQQERTCADLHHPLAGGRPGVGHPAFLSEEPPKYFLSCFRSSRHADVGQLVTGPFGAVEVGAWCIEHNNEARFHCIPAVVSEESPDNLKESPKNAAPFIGPRIVSSLSTLHCVSACERYVGSQEP